MAGYKHSVLALEPVSFVTFDADNMFNPATGMLESPVIVDESGNDNNMLLHTDDNPVKSYLMGQPSLIERETNSGQHSIKIAPYGQTNYNNFPYEKTFLEIINSGTTDFVYDYSILLNFNKVHDTELQGKSFDTQTGLYVNNLTTRETRRYLFNKGSTIAAYFLQTQLQGTFLVVVFPQSIHEYRITDVSKFFGVTNHLAVTQRRVTVGAGQFYLERRVYLNGTTIISSDSAVQTTLPTANNTASWYFGGTNDAIDVNTLNDRQTTPLTLDQVALFDKCLDKYTVANLYKKSVSYTTLIERTTPLLHIPLDDRTLTAGNNMRVVQPTAFTASGAQYSGREPATTRLVKYSSKVDTEVGVEFMNANAVVGTTVATQVSLQSNTDNEFTLSFWLSFSSTTRGVVFSYQEKTHPYKGLLCEVNMKGLEPNQGLVQFKLQEDVFVTVPEFDANGNKTNYADGVARHYTLTMKENVVKLYVNGTVVASIGAVYTLPTQSQVIHLMGMSPSNMNVTGVLSHVTFHSYCLEEQIIQVLCWFMVVSKIRGRITLDGFPTIGDIRVFDNLTGLILYESKSDADGWYDIILNTSNYVDIMYFVKGNSNITYRTIGGVLADEYEDVDWF